MDRRDDPSQQNVYQKELEEQMSGRQVVYEDQVMIEGKAYRVPYKAIKEIELSNIKLEEMVDLEHAGRLQYRLMLLEPVIRAKVEFIKGKITVVYNPAGAQNNKPKMSKEEIFSFLEGEGVHADPHNIKERDFDYFKEMYSYHFDPPSIRERPPYGYTMDEWKKMRDKYHGDTEEGKAKARQKFKEWQDGYAAEHPEILSDKLPAGSAQRRVTLKERIFGKKKKGEKGFWFHGV